MSTGTDLVAQVCSASCLENELLWLARVGKHADIKQLLQEGADVHARDYPRLYTALLHAAEWCRPKVVKLLIDWGSDVEAALPTGSTSMHLAAEKGHVAAPKALLAAHASVHSRDNSGCTPLHAAASTGQVGTMQLLLDAGADVNTRNNAQQTPLHLSSFYGQEQASAVLLEAGADVAARSSKDLTPLHYASAAHHLAVVQVLLGAGAPVNAVTKWGATALYLACRCVRVNKPGSRVLEALISNGAQLDIQTDEGYIALHAACLGSNTEWAACLLQADPSPAHVNAMGGAASFTPLHVACVRGAVQLAALLLEAGADQQAVDAAGYTPMTRAVQHGHTAVVEQLLAAGADPGAVVHGVTLLHVAAQSGHTAVLQQLLAAMGAGQRGVLVGAVAQGMTALHLAAQIGHTGCVELLIAAGASANQLYGAGNEAADGLEGATVLHCVVQRGHLALVPLLATPANLHHLWQGQTPLHLALATSCQPSMVQALMAAGAPLGVRNAAGATALVQAASSTDAGVRALLPAMVRRQCETYKQLQQGSHDQQQEQPVQQALEACLANVGDAVNVLMLAHAAAVSDSTRDVATSCIQVVKEMVGGSDTSQLVQVVLLACKLRDLEHPGRGTSKVLLVMQGLTSACCAALEPLMQQRWRITSRLEQLVPAPEQHQQPANAAAGGNDARAADSGSHLSAQALAAATGGEWPRFVQLWEQLMGRQPAQASRLMSQVQEQLVDDKMAGMQGLCEALLEAWQAARQQVAGRMRQELTAAVVSAVQAGQGHMAAARSLLRRGWRKKGAKPCRG